MNISAFSGAGGLVVLGKEENKKHATGRCTKEKPMEPHSPPACRTESQAVKHGRKELWLVRRGLPKLCAFDRGCMGRKSLPPRWCRPSRSQPGSNLNPSPSSNNSTHIACYRLAIPHHTHPSHVPNSSLSHTLAVDTASCSIRQNVYRLLVSRNPCCCWPPLSDAVASELVGSITLELRDPSSRCIGSAQQSPFLTDQIANISLLYSPVYAVRSPLLHLAD